MGTPKTVQLVRRWEYIAVEWDRSPISKDAFKSSYESFLEQRNRKKKTYVHFTIDLNQTWVLFTKCSIKVEYDCSFEEISSKHWFYICGKTPFWDTWRQKKTIIWPMLDSGQNSLKTSYIIRWLLISAISADLSKIENLRFLSNFRSFFTRKFSLKK